MSENTLKEQAVSHVLYGIIKGEYSQDALLSEKQLCERLDMSKSPVREALVELCSQGVLRSIPRHGYRVVRYTERNLYDIVQYRVLVECGCLEHSFEHITPIQLCTLSDRVKQEFSFLSEKNTLDYWNDTLNFHLTLVSFDNNEFVYKQLKFALHTYMQAYLQFYWEQYLDTSLLRPSVLHRSIVENIRGGNKTAALQNLKEDILTMYEFNQKA